MFEVNFDAIKHNALYIKQKVFPSKVCAVVKSDAYGHGIVDVANCICNVVDYFAVGNVNEGKLIYGLGKDVLILLPATPLETLIAINRGLVLTVDSYATLKTVLQSACKLNKKARVHVKLDTGMSRLGFDIDGIYSLKPLFNQQLLNVEGVYSHFACADFDEQYTNLQFDRFCKAVDVLQGFSANKLTAHISNTSATFLNKKYCLDMVRVGLGLYGYGDKNLQPAKTVFGRILSVKTLPKGSFIGYGNTYQTTKTTKVAVVDVGYANGLTKGLSNQLLFEVNGVACRQIGSICMGMTMVDVSRCHACVDDKVILLGKGVPFVNGQGFIYEILCNLR